MKLKYYGTGGGGGIPEMFCSCSICANARNKGGKELRRRSLAMVDDRLVIDLPCDARDSLLAHRADPTKIRYVLVTHAHYDHFLPDNFISRPEGAHKMELCISRGSGADFAQRCEKLEKASVPRNLRPINVPRVRLARAFDSFRLGDYGITALEAAHAAELESLNYLISSGEKKILWLHDSGLLTEAVKQWLKAHRPKLSLVSMDCALPLGSPVCKEHMDLNACVETADFLRSIGCIGENTQLLLSHIGHNTAVTHEELLSAAKEYGFRPAYDGEEIEI